MIRSPRSPLAMGHTFGLGTFFVSCAVWFAAVGAPPTLTDDDPEDRAFRRAVAERAVRENCLSCHSDEMITSQRLTAKQWKAEVEKMVGWGSPLPQEMQQPVIDDLAAEYPPDAPPASPARLTGREVSALARSDTQGPTVAGDPARGAAEYARNCANCHGPDGQGAELGTNLVEKPILYRAAEYSDVVRKGRGRMPGFASATDAAVESDILAWLRARRFRPVMPK